MLYVTIILFFFLLLNLECTEGAWTKEEKLTEIQIYTIFKRDPVIYDFFRPLYTRTMFEENEMVPRNVMR